MTAVRSSPGDETIPSPRAVGTPEQTRLVKALADPVRLRMVGLIAAAPPEGICVCDVVAEFDVSQPTISHHLKLLRDANLVDSHRRGTWAYYTLRPAALEPLRGLLDALDVRHQSGAAQV